MNFSPFLRGLGESLRVCRYTLVKHFDRAGVRQFTDAIIVAFLKRLLLDRLLSDVELLHFSKFSISIRFMLQWVELVSYLVLNELL